MGTRGGIVDPGEVGQRLRGHLAEALPAHQGLRAVPPAQRLGDAHHQPPVDHHAQGRRHAQDDLALDLAEGDEAEHDSYCQAVNRSARARVLACEVAGR